MWKARDFVLPVAVGLCVALAGCAGLNTTRKKQVVVLDILQTDDPALTAAVVALVAPDYLVVTDDYRITARRLQAESTTVEDIGLVASSLGVDAVITGEVVVRTVKKRKRRRSRRSKRRGRRWVEVEQTVLALDLRDGNTGEAIETYEIPLRDHEISERGQRVLDGAFLAALDELTGFVRGEPADPAGQTSAVATAPGKAKNNKRAAASAARANKTRRAASAARPKTTRAVASAAKPRKKRPAAAAKSKNKRAVASAARPNRTRASAAKPKKSGRVASAAKPKKSGRVASAAKSGTKPASTPEQDIAPLEDIAYDDRGQALDDEVPPGF